MVAVVGRAEALSGTGPIAASRLRRWQRRPLLTGVRRGVTFDALAPRGASAQASPPANAQLGTPASTITTPPRDWSPGPPLEPECAEMILVTARGQSAFGRGDLPKTRSRPSGVNINPARPFSRPVHGHTPAKARAGTVKWFGGRFAEAVGSSSHLTPRWREMDSNHRYLARRSRFLLRKAMRGIEPEAPSAPDSPLEETRFEPSVPP